MLVQKSPTLSHAIELRERVGELNHLSSIKHGVHEIMAHLEKIGNRAVLGSSIDI